MVSSVARTVAAYLAELPEERRRVVSKVREVIRKHLPRGYEEAMGGMIVYQIPLKSFPDTYNKQPLAYVGLAAQKNNYAVYLMSVYGDRAIEAWWRAGYKARGLKLDMGKSCVRFKKLEELPLDLLGECVAKLSVEEYLARYAAAKGSMRQAPAKRAAKRATRK